MTGLPELQAHDVQRSQLPNANSGGDLLKLQIGTDFGYPCRDTAAAKDVDVKAAVARLAKLAAISEMQLETLQLQAEGNRIGQLGVSSGGIMGTQLALHHVTVLSVYMDLQGNGTVYQHSINNP